MGERLQGKVVLITGTGSGIGRAAALLFASEGAKIAGCDIDAERAAETEHLVKEAGGEMRSATPVDLADSEQVTAWVDATAAHFGGIDVLYNNAGFSPAGTFEAKTPEQWYESMRNEVDVVYFPTHAVWRHMKERGGSIISTGSVTAHQTNGTHL